jgi:hypothetical protein
MIKNVELFRQFEQKWIAGQKADPVENMRIFEDLYQFARQMGKFPGDNPLEGIESKIHLASLLRRAGGRRG